MRVTRVLRTHLGDIDLEQRAAAFASVVPDRGGGVKVQEGSYTNRNICSREKRDFGSGLAQ